MIICLIGIGICAFLGFLCLHKYICECKENKWYNKYYNTKEKSEEETLYRKKYKAWRKAHNWISECIGEITLFVIIILTFVFGLTFLATKGQNNNLYKEALDTKTQIEYVLENNIVVNEDKDSLIVKAIEINNQIKYYKRVQNNPWINWFGNDNLANMEEINLDSFA